jgi:Flp pilus assembly protein protease CpaA
VYKKTIPSALILLLLGLGMVYSFLNDGWMGLVHSILSGIITFLIGFFVLWGIMGAGDVKLFIGISMFIGTVATLKVILLTIFIASVAYICLNPKRFALSLKMITNFIFYFVPLRIYDKKKTIALAPFISLAFFGFYLFL